MRMSVTAILVAFLVTALGLSACGRKGPLERPKAATAADGTVAQEVDRRPNRPFILDRLLR